MILRRIGAGPVRAVVAALALALAACATPPAERTDRGIGGTGIGGTALADRGIGGTGISNARVADRGLGGTGITGSTLIADRGIGGTGIVGTVTGFGSILVNGLRITVPPSVSVTEDGKPANTDALARGQVIAITAIHEGGTLAAQTIHIRHLAVGYVSHNGSLRVAGQRIVTDTATIGSVPETDRVVAVSGFRRYDGAILATRIVPVAADSGWMVVGVSRIRGDQVTIGGATYTLDGLPPPDGTRIELTGTIPGRATGWTALPALPFTATVDQLSIESLTGADGVPEAARDLGVAAPATYAPGTRVILEVVLPDDRGGADRGPPPGSPPPHKTGAPPAASATPGGHHGGPDGPGHEGRGRNESPSGRGPDGGPP